MAVTSADVAELLQIPVEQVRVRLHQQVRKQQFFSPARGLWIPIPPDYRTWGAVPAMHFLDQVMQFLERDYYVGWLSAAELHGAAHQRPQVFQVAVSAALVQRDFGRVRLRFVTRSRVDQLPRMQMQTPTGHVWVSTPELTALDLVDLPRLSWGLNNATTVIMELAQDPGLDPAKLHDAARAFSHRNRAAPRLSPRTVRHGYRPRAASVPARQSATSPRFAPRPTRAVPR